MARGTPMTSPMIEWDHSLEWAVANFAGKGSARSGECVIDIDLSKDTDAFLSGHAIDGRVLFPATGYLVSRLLPQPLLNFFIFAARDILLPSKHYFSFISDFGLENIRQTSRKILHRSTCYY